LCGWPEALDFRVSGERRSRMSSLHDLLVAQSPRLTPRAVPLVSTLICAGAGALFLALLAPTFLRQGLAVWSVGIAYILYDTFLLAFTATRIAGLKRDDEKSPVTLRPSLAVIVAAHNEASVLDATLERLAAQDDAPDLVVIADDGSSDETAVRLARHWGLTAPALGDMSAPSARWPALRWLRLPHGGKARALNAAIQRIDTDLVLTVDADTMLDAGAVGAMRRAFGREPALVAATGVLTPVCQRYEYVRNFLSRHAWMQLDSLLLISGAFAAFRRDALLAVGGFDPDCLVEDYELIHRLHRHAADGGLDWRVRVVGGAHAQTDAPATLPAFLRQRRR
jgi:cellulose synthase/poly-beta-1,6-N-acetylglucosamine synthase-like glycosyltransferase